jgi:pimeloyl-ACP methyl ester carboxylesterase
MAPSRSGHLPVNGLRLYYETHGDSQRVPLLLIPGAFMSTDGMRHWVAAFADERPVIVFDQQGHGRTADTARAMSYERFGDDAAELLRALGVGRADVLGYSQGGGVALQLALRHPQLAGKLVVISATYRQDGWYPAALRGVESLKSEFFAGTPISEAFRRHTTDPAAFDAYVEKMRVLGFEDQHLTDTQLRSINAKAMVIIGDADAVRPEHALSMFQLLGGGDEEAAATGTISATPKARLVILPATSHISIMSATAILKPLITAFLDDTPPADAALW